MEGGGKSCEGKNLKRENGQRRGERRDAEREKEGGGEKVIKGRKGRKEQVEGLESKGTETLIWGGGAIGGELREEEKEKRVGAEKREV